MTLSSTSHPEFSKKLATVGSRLFYYFSLYIVPASIVFFSAAALFMLNDRYPATSGHALQFRMFTDPGSAPSPDTALAALKRRELVSTASVDGPTCLLFDFERMRRVQGPRVSVRVGLGCLRFFKKKTIIA